MTEGSVYKQCSCREHGRRLGARCPKLRRTGGNWSPTHGSWGYQIELPRTADSKRRPLRRAGFTSREHAVTERTHALALLNLAAGDPTVADEIATLLVSVKHGQPLPDRDLIARRVRAGVQASASQLVGPYLWQWHRSRKIQPTTLTAYATHIRKYLEPHLGHLPIDQLRVAHIQAMFDTITDRNTHIELAKQSNDPTVRAGVKGWRTVSPSTMHRIRSTLRKALNDAIRTHRLLEFNPAAHIELPSGKRPKAKVWTPGAVAEWRRTGQRPSPVMVWMPAHAGAFLDHTERHEPDLYPMYVLILHRGLRRGEAVGLRDADIDLDTGILTISQQITTVGYEAVTKTVKSDAGERTLALDTTTTAVLREHLTRRARWQLAAGPTWPHTGLLFVQPNGTPWHPGQISDRFERLIIDADLPPIRLHDLRHCTATYLKAAGSDLKDIQTTLGHASITLTADTYTSVIVEMATERAKADAATALIPRTLRQPANPTSGRPTRRRTAGNRAAARHLEPPPPLTASGEWSERVVTM